MQSPDGLGAQSPAWATETKGIKAMQAMAARARGLIFMTLSDFDPAAARKRGTTICCIASRLGAAAGFPATPRTASHGLVSNQSM